MLRVLNDRAHKDNKEAMEKKTKREEQVKSMDLAFNIANYDKRKEEGGLDETGVAVKLEAHEHEIESLKYRVKDLEMQNKAIQELAISVNKMAVSIENMLKELNRQGERLERLERVPTETGKLIKAAIITALVGGIVGAMVAAILTLM